MYNKDKYIKYCTEDGFMDINFTELFSQMEKIHLENCSEKQ
jgi:hypothetical protein